MQPYDALAEVYDRWTAANDYNRWAEFVSEAVAGDPGGSRILDLCCGTGRLATLLQQLGHQVTGVDRSKAMLRQAATALRPGTPLHRIDLTAAGTSTHTVLDSKDPGFDAAICTFDSVNYFIEPHHVRALFGFAAGVVRPQGIFLFDVNTRHKLESVFGNSHYGDDLSDFAYVWRNRYDADARICRFLITLYTASGDHFLRWREEHCQRWFDRAELQVAAEDCGFTVESVTDDYTHASSTGNTLRETWLLRRQGHG